MHSVSGTLLVVQEQIVCWVAGHTGRDLFQPGELFVVLGCKLEHNNGNDVVHLMTSQGPRACFVDSLGWRTCVLSCPHVVG